MKLKKTPKIIALVLMGLIILSLIDMFIAMSSKSVPLMAIKHGNTYNALYYKVFKCNDEYKFVSYFSDFNC
ncbi:MAG: hypothetical protein SOT41_05150 [Candidatus Faecisoma sp.]|nr:hypothetical protein [Acholeplasma sp.]MDY2893144.1 hypothetical protein [Candidatus Faecisoma sp.]